MVGVYDYGLGTRPNRRLAFTHYKIAADARRPNAEYHVGVFYYDGRAVPRDYGMALQWLCKAASHGDQTAVYWLGQCYLHGRGVARDEKKGFRLELAAANKRVIEAQYSVGVCYELGQGVRSDPKKAFRWYLTAAKRGRAQPRTSL
jgi:TPR repeat protein